jgi:hypothetical protein
MMLVACGFEFAGLLMHPAGLCRLHLLEGLQDETCRTTSTAFIGSNITHSPLIICLLLLDEPPSVCHPSVVSTLAARLPYLLVGFLSALSPTFCFSITKPERFSSLTPN